MSTEPEPWCPSDPDELRNRVPHKVTISVRIITFNHACYVRQALESVLMQKVSVPYEILIGEDDSTDGTREICVEYASKHPEKIRLFCRKSAEKIMINGRVTGRRNAIRTAQACRGKYIALLEGDDFWIDDQKIQKQYELMEANPDAAMCGARCLAVDTMEKDLPEIFPRLSYGSFLSRRHICNGDAFVHLSTFFVRRTEFLSLPDWTKQVIQGDLAVQLEMSRSMGGVPILTMVASVYRKTGSGIWTNQIGAAHMLMHESFFRKVLEISEVNQDREGGAAARRMIRYYHFRATVPRRNRVFYRLRYLLHMPGIGLKELLRSAVHRLARKARVI